MSDGMTLDEWLVVAQFVARYFGTDIRKKRLDPLAVESWQVGERRSVTLGGQLAGWVSLPSPTTRVTDKDRLLAWCRKHLPEAIETVTVDQVRPETAKALVEDVKRHGGWPRGGDADDVIPVDGIAQNELSPKVDLSPDAQAAVGAAWEAGEIDLGRLLALRAAPGPARPKPLPEAVSAGVTGEREPSGPPFCDEHGFKSPVMAAAHAVMVQGGFTTPLVEAYRMIRDGGIAAERAQAWLEEQGLPLDDPLQGTGIAWPLAARAVHGE